MSFLCLFHLFAYFAYLVILLCLIQQNTNIVQIVRKTCILSLFVNFFSNLRISRKNFVQFTYFVLFLFNTAKYKCIEKSEWYFFTPRERKYKKGSRPNRAAGSGYWKATGVDIPIKSNGETVGFKKSLVFYRGKPPNGGKSNWIVNEYRIKGGVFEGTSRERDMSSMRVKKSNFFKTLLVEFFFLDILLHLNYSLDFYFYS